MSEDNTTAKTDKTIENKDNEIVDSTVEQAELKENEQKKATIEVSDKSDEKSEDKSDEKTGDKTEQPVEEKIEMVQIPKKRLEELETVEARVLEELKLERADSINYRKRLEKQRNEFAEIASVRVLNKILAIKDDIDRIVETGKDDIPETHYKGLELLQQRIDGIFSQEKVELIKIDVGKTIYDPIKHEAIVAQPMENVKPNTIINIVSAGFIKGERVLRAAKVIISKAIENDKKDIEDEDVEFKEF